MLAFEMTVQSNGMAKNSAPRPCGLESIDAGRTGQSQNLEAQEGTQV